MKIKSYLQLFTAIAVSELAGLVGSFFTMPAVSGWYATLEKSELTPPDWVFGPVWTILYLLMGVAAFLVWRKGLEKKEVRVALAVFGVQLALNTLWSIVFFGLQSPSWALASIFLLWLSIAATMRLFYKIAPPTVCLLLPYILWVSFAAYLNYAIWLLN